MIDTPKVVEGGPVTFEGGVSLPDVLSPPAEPAVHKPEIVSAQMDPVAYQGFSQYLANVALAVQNERKWPQSPWPSLATVVPYLRFESGMEVTATTVPKPFFLSLVQQENPTLAQLLTTTDLGEDIPDPCIIDRLPEVFEVLGYSRSLNITQELQDLLVTSRGRLDIPWGYFVSLLIENGETYRKFLEHSGQATTNSYISGERRSLRIVTISPLVSFDKLEQFVRETGESHVAGFIKDLQSLDNDLRKYLTAGRPGNVITCLYERLKQYHPELTV